MVVRPFRKPRIVKLPSLSVFVSDLAPWSLTAWIARSIQGLPVTSRICPLTTPSCAAAFGANAHSKAMNTTIDIAHEFLLLQRTFMPHSPLPFESLPVSRWRAPIISKPGRMPSSRLCCHRSPVRNRVRYSSFGERAQTQQATVASATGCIFALITGPRQMQRSPEFDTATDNLALLQRDHWRDNFDVCLGPRTGSHQFLKCLVILGPAVR